MKKRKGESGRTSRSKLVTEVTNTENVGADIDPEDDGSADAEAFDEDEEDERRFDYDSDDEVGAGAQTSLRAFFYPS